METENRPLDRTLLLAVLAAAATDLEPRNILLAGPWGSGKTALLRDLPKHIEERSGSDAPYVIWFSPWSTVADGDPRVAFLRLLRNRLQALTKTVPKSAADKTALVRIRNIVKAIGKCLKTPWAQAGLRLFPPPLDTLVQVMVSLAPLAEALIKNAEIGDGQLQDDMSPIQQMRNGVRQMLQDIARYGRKDTEPSRRILLLVDDLDRARPEEAVAVLDSLYHLFMPHMEEDEDAKDKWPLTSVWAVNTAVLEEYLYREYRELPSFDPNAYLEKLFCQRVNVPPLIEDGKQGDTTRLWRQILIEATTEDCSCIDGLAKLLSDQINYSILGNLRLHARVRRDCVQLWGNASSMSTDDFVRDARLIVLIDAFSYFREQIAPFNGMWPHFLNQVNKRLTDRPMEWIANPLYRHVDSPDLATLLVDLGVVRYVEDRQCYELDPEGRSRLQRDLNTFWKHGI